MKALLGFVGVANVLAGVVVWFCHRLWGWPTINYPSDYLFFNALILWGLAGLLWDGGRQGRFYDRDRGARKAQSLVTDFDHAQSNLDEFRANFHTGLKLFIAGLVAMVGSFMLNQLS
ncbi:hypothetical protein VV869_18240 [Photobacterium sp. MCCC 1A19761]|uniref:hypothetical protein n=1 Tax=Photobacterium sp. MCCC 1A19761 TaxID=3115000 RepID=UPI00307F3163